ncbi:hypothetical protein BTB_502p07330 (plasmid) [Bacillus thuringiensis Bt407]|uniref:Uncharacterized protein n=1 Tax=Bacillus thuringiensis T01-328 TaxID=1324966 RepID=A0AAN4HJC8_BACTU|nr:hypothetical protein BTB_502p07330 [Bacillus thuringiensis Bt407]ERI00785.1 hypothetical protein BTCBT_002340 [Bacillus thuringiensis T01-328]
MSKKSGSKTPDSGMSPHTKEILEKSENAINNSSSNR